MVVFLRQAIRNQLQARGPKELSPMRRRQPTSEKETESRELFRQRRPLITRFLAENSLAPSLQNEGRRNRPVTRYKGAAFCTFDVDLRLTRRLDSHFCTK